VYGIPFDFFATGHYAIAEYDKPLRRYVLKKAVDAGKDQSYFLFLLTQEQLSQTLFPLGRYTKKQVRALAEKHNLPVSDKEESQDFVAETGFFFLSAAPEKDPCWTKTARSSEGIKELSLYHRAEKRAGNSGKIPLYITGIDRKTNSITVGRKGRLRKGTNRRRRKLRGD